MKQTKSKTYAENLRIQLIPKKNILLSKNFLIFYEYESPENPIFIFFKHKQKLYPVNNFKILHDYLETDKEITGIILKEPTQIIHILKIFFREESLNLVEKIQLAKFLRFFNIDPLLPNFKADKFLKYQEILTLPEEAIEMISKDIIPIDLAMKLKNIERSNLHNFLKLIKNFKLTQSQQREVFSFMKDRINIQEFESLVKKSKDRETFIEKIREITMPEYTKTKKIFNQNKNKLNLPPKINLIETPFFESKNMKIEIFFKNYQELTDKINKLSKNLEEKRNIWEEIFSII